MMLRRAAFASSLVLAALATACGSSPPPEPAPPPPPVAPPPPPVTAAPTAEAPPPPPEPTAEEKKKAEAKAALDADRAKMKADNDKEDARWTPAIHDEAKTLADKAFPSTKAAVQAEMACKCRRPGDADRDKYRHPAETLDFFGLKPNMTVLEYGPGDGWYTELLAPMLAKKGKLLVTNGDPNGPADDRGTFYAQRYKSLLDRSPEMFGKVEVVTLDGKAPPKVGHEGTVDLVVLTREVHGMINSGKLDAWLAEFNKALKPNGVLGIEEHRAKGDADPIESAKKGYVPEKYVIEKVEAAGFKLAGKSDVNKNDKDTKDYADGVWDLPPTLRAGDKDKDKYVAIGESDRMTLKFVKVPAKAAPAAAPAKPAAATTATKPAPAPAATPAPAPKK